MLYFLYKPVNLISCVPCLDYSEFDFEMFIGF